jgi:hypothetical protein
MKYLNDHCRSQLERSIAEIEVMRSGRTKLRAEGLTCALYENIGGACAVKLENVRYYTTVLMMVLGAAGFYTMLVLWLIEQFITLSEDTLLITALLIYIALSIVGLIHAIPRFRGVL